MITETTTESWSSRVGSSFKGIAGGLALVVASFALLFWNEGRTIKETKALKEGAQNVVSVDVAQIDSNNEGRLIHVSGKAKTTDVLNEDFFGVSLNALKLSRVVEAYQWEEQTETKTERASGGGEKKTTTYSYRKVWSSELIDSSNFKESGHDNPTGLPVENAEYYASDVSLGAFKLPERLVQRLAVDSEKAYNPFEAKKSDADEESKPEEAKPVEAAPEEAGSEEVKPKETVVPSEKVENVPNQDSSAYMFSTRLVERFSAAVLDDYDEYDSDSQPKEEEKVKKIVNGFVPYQNGYYRGDPNFAQIGDVRVTFTYVPTPSEISVVSEQLGDTFTPYQAKTGEVELVSSGLVSADKMFTDAQNANKAFAWILRVIGVFLMYCGFNAFFRPLVVISNVVPFMARVVDFGTGFISFCLTLCLSSLTIAVGWLTYRPLIGVPLLILSIVAIVAPFVLKKKKNG